MVENDGLTISVITPSLNQGGYIEETILSVIRQEGNFHIDYLIKDGGSTDGSVDIIRKYVETVNGGDFRPRCNSVRIRWVSEKDAGQTHAINKGLREAEGGLITWINSDDYYLPGAFSRAEAFFRRHPGTDFVHADGLIVDEYGRTKSEHLTRRFNLRQQLSFLYPLDRFAYCIMQPGSFWRRSVHERLGFLDESFDFAMDAEFYLRAAAAGLKFAHIPHKLAAFRLIEGTKSKSSKTVFWPDMLEIFRRHHGAGALEPFLARYFYEEGYHSGYDTGHMEGRKDAMLKRWSSLDGTERETLAGLSARALPSALLRLCDKALLDGDLETAQRLADEALARMPSLRTHPRMLAYRFKKAAGVGVARLIERIKRTLLHFYGFRYDYRYIFRKFSRIFGAKQ